MNNKEQSFGGLTPSKTLEKAVNRAARLGLDTSGEILMAVESARQEGRTKVGGFGSAKPYVVAIRDAVTKEIWSNSPANPYSKNR